MGTIRQSRFHSRLPVIHKRTWLILALLSLAACSSAEISQSDKPASAQPAGNLFTDTIVGTFKGAWSAVQTPFEDINIKRKPIPEKLQQLTTDPYEMKPRLSCQAIEKEIGDLDALLGPDIYMTQNMTAPEKKRYIEQGASLAREQTVSMIGSKANFIPFRGVVRSISGADRHAKAVELAYESGKIRRAFLKGIGAARGPSCLTGNGLLTKKE